METINILDETGPAITLMNILAERINGKDQFDTVRKKKTDGSCYREMEVSLKVNGVEISWMDIIVNLWKIRDEEVEKRVTKKLEEMAGFEKIKDFAAQLESLEWDMKSRIETLLGKNIEWSEKY